MTQLKCVTSQSGRQMLKFIRQMINLSANTKIYIKTSHLFSLFTRQSGGRILNFNSQGRIAPAFGGKVDVMP